jgi:hypothetical protein
MSSRKIEFAEALSPACCFTHTAFATAALPCALTRYSTSKCGLQLFRLRLAWTAPHRVTSIRTSRERLLESDPQFPNDHTPSICLLLVSFQACDGPLFGSLANRGPRAIDQDTKLRLESRIVKIVASNRFLTRARWPGRSSPHLGEANRFRIVLAPKRWVTRIRDGSARIAPASLSSPFRPL